MYIFIYIGQEELSIQKDFALTYKRTTEPTNIKLKTWEQNMVYILCTSSLILSNINKTITRIFFP